MAVVLAALVVVGGSLTGCARGDLADRQAPAAGVTASSSAPVPINGDDGSLQSIQEDLNSADSATNNAGGDVADADSAAATSDSP